MILLATYLAMVQLLLHFACTLSVTVSLFTCLLAVGTAQMEASEPQDYQEKLGASAAVSSDRTENSLSVLLLSSCFVGHTVALLGIGEELVNRGHNVTFFATEPKGSNIIPQLPESLGVRYMSAGPDALSREEFEIKLKGVRFIEITKMIINISIENFLRMRQAIDTKLRPSDWDIVVVDHALVSIVKYLGVEWQAKTILHMTISPVIPAMDPPWPFPNLAEYPDNMNFLQRLMNTALYSPLLKLGFWFLLRSHMKADAVLATALKDEPNIYTTIGLENPVISTAAFGFEYARPLLPTVHFVGPTMIKSSPPINPDLEQWLKMKEEKKVVYISMGSSAPLTAEMGRAIIEGILGVGYDVVWSLRESNRDILEGIELDGNRIYISEWVSQQTLLQHKAIGAAILHGGLNGVQQAIYYKVPTIIIPFGMDQPLIAARVHSKTFGIRLYSSELTKENIANSIQALQSDEYKKQLEKQSKIYNFAGGSKAAADLAEHYAEVGFNHLIPAYYKYKWTWVQYYNVDVYAVLIGTLTVSLYLLYKALRCTCSKCCYQSVKLKTKDD